MKNNNVTFFIILFSFIYNLGSSQKSAQFEMNFYFEDSKGFKDTLNYRADTSIIDDEARLDDDLNSNWGEKIDNSPFEKDLEVRGKSAFNLPYDFYQNLILKSNDNGQGCISPEPILIFVYTSNWPIKMTWDQDYFRKQSCLYGTFATPDAEYARKWLFNDPVPIREIACLGSMNVYVKDLREDVLAMNYELPYRIKHEVTGKGKIPITAIQIYFGRPWAHLCDTLTAVNDLANLDVSIYPTIVLDQLHIINNNSEVLNCQIINIEGKLIKIFITDRNEYSINLESLNKGIYFIMLQNNKGNRIIKKIMKS